MPALRSSRRHDARGEATERYGVVWAFLEQGSQAPRAGLKPAAVALARQVLAAAQAAQNRGVESNAHRLLGMLTEGAEARGHLAECLRTAETLRERGYCLNTLARHLAG